MHFIYGYFIIQLKCFNAFNWLFISQLDPGAQKDQIPERWPGLHWNSQCKGSISAFSCIVTLTITIYCIVSALPFLVCHFLSISLFNLGARLYCTYGVQCTIKLTVHYVEMHCRSFCLSFTLSGERQNRSARPSGGPVSLPSI